MQVCRLCGEQKPFDAFTYRKDNGKHRSDCKECRSEREQASRYGLTVEGLRDLQSAHGLICGICRRLPDEIPHESFRNKLVVDHCHETGRVRGLLCPTCNSGLGHFKDSLQLLAAAQQYLTL